MKTHQLIAYIACAAPIAATAQDNNNRPDGLDTIVVTAARTPMERLNVGSSMTVISRDRIDQQQARYVTDLLRSVPGFSVSQSGATGSQTQVRVRGSESNHVLVLIDGVRANDPASSDDFRWEFLSTGDVERIEIVRGPQSSLWGSEAVGAVVHVITRQDNQAPQIGGYAEGGSFSTVNAGLNGGFGSDRMSIRFGLENLETDGTNVSRVGDEDDGAELTTASVSGEFQATDALDLNLGIRAVEAYSEYDAIDFINTGLPVDADIASDSTQLSAYARGTLTTLDGRWVHRLNANYFDSDNRNLVDGTKDSSTSSDRTTINYQSDFYIGDNVMSVALEHEKTNFQQRGEIGFGDPNQDQDISVNSLMAEYQGRSIDSFTWLLSARYDDNSNFKNALTGRLSVAWNVTESTKLRSSLGSGQKNPTFTERFGFFPGQFIGNPDLKPETSISFDVGIDQQFLQDKLELQLTIFSQNLEDEINGFVFDPETFLFTAENMDGSSSRTGVEVAGLWRPSEKLQLAASYTYTDATEEDALGEDVEELRRPKHVGSLSADYRFFEQRAHIMLLADYGGSRNDIFFPPFPDPTEIVSLDSYWLLNATIGFDITRSVNVFARGTNLLDEDYEEVYGFSNPGRAAYVGIRVKFGQ